MQSFAASELFFSAQKVSECPLALLLLQAGDEGLFSELGLDRDFKERFENVPEVALKNSS